MYRTRVRNMAHPGIRQFILRTAVLNYLGKSLQFQWADWQNQHMHQRSVQEEIAKATEQATLDQVLVARAALEQTIEELREKVLATHKLLLREYNDLYSYMMDKRDLWDSPEYFKAKTALTTANQNLKLFIAVDN
ncbi:CG14684 [Drosophila busckii]|uniref:CG14684 n=1 Tax=Drosophila busckii TaxID=30019 RepID=A0A0M4EXM2_DROBS|nr:uncharacterized protein LOC108595819 [Drosophila busckii]ALC42770.1 CG14684 [Drosophila busckii]